MPDIARMYWRLVCFIDGRHIRPTDLSVYGRNQKRLGYARPRCQRCNRRLDR